MPTIKDQGSKIECDANLIVFAKGMHNLGPVYEIREATSANLAPGLGVIHATGAAGEDYYTEHGISTHLGYAIVELDTDQIADCDTVYAIYDNVPAIPYHLNYGAYLRNIVCADPAADVDPDTILVAAATGTFEVGIEPTLVNQVDNLAFDATATVGLNGTAGTNLFSRALLRQAYFLTDPNAAYDTVAYTIKLS